MSDKLVTIASYLTDIDAEMDKGKLTSSGVDAFVFKDDCGGMRPHMQLTAGVLLKIYEKDVAVAQEILTIDEDSEQQDSDIDKKINQLVYRARGWILVGFAVIPGWISFPVSYIYASKAFQTYQFHDLDDFTLRNRIVRLKWISLIFSALFWGFLILYIADAFLPEYLSR